MSGCDPPPAGLSIDASTVGQDVLAQFTDDEASCVLDVVASETVEDLTARPVLEEEWWFEGFPFNDLAEETAIDLSIGLAAVAAGGMDEETRQCLGKAYEEPGAIEFEFILSSEFASGREIDAVAFVLQFALCLTDDQAKAFEERRPPFAELPPPSDLRCAFDEVEVEQSVAVVAGRGQFLTGRPSPEFRRSWEAVSSAFVSCGVEDFVAVPPPPSARERLLWRFRASSYVAGSPVVADDVVYVGAGDDWLYAVDADD